MNYIYGIDIPTQQVTLEVFETDLEPTVEVLDLYVWARSNTSLSHAQNRVREKLDKLSFDLDRACDRVNHGSDNVITHSEFVQRAKRAHELPNS